MAPLIILFVSSMAMMIIWRSLITIASHKMYAKTIDEGGIVTIGALTYNTKNLNELFKFVALMTEVIAIDENDKIFSKKCKEAAEGAIENIEEFAKTAKEHVKKTMKQDDVINIIQIILSAIIILVSMVLTNSL